MLRDRLRQGVHGRHARLAHGAAARRVGRGDHELRGPGRAHPPSRARRLRARRARDRRPGQPRRARRLRGGRDARRAPPHRARPVRRARRTPRASPRSESPPRCSTPTPPATATWSSASGPTASSTPTRSARCGRRALGSPAARTRPSRNSTRSPGCAPPSCAPTPSARRGARSRRSRRTRRFESFTVAPAWLSFDEHRRGRLRAGFDADLVVLDRDPLAHPPASVADARLVATMVAGEWVHGPGW